MSGARRAGTHLERLELHDLRAFSGVVIEPDPEGTTVLAGRNGSGKTTILEAVAFLGTLRSFRTASREAMVRAGCDRAIVRADLERDGLPALVEVELPATGRPRALVNRQAVRERRELARTVPVTVFSPADLDLVQGGPAGRRDLLDDALRLVDPRVAPSLEELDRILRQRAALLRQAGGRLDAGVATTLDVWDDRLAGAGAAVAAARRDLVSALQAPAAAAYAALASDRAGPTGGAIGSAGPTGGVLESAGGVPEPAGGIPGQPGGVVLSYRMSWSGNLAEALAASRAEDVRRGLTTIGPHRDDLDLELAGRDARLQASRGEQRSLALALRLAVHHLVTERAGAPPILLLDDVFSELDPERSRALVRQLPPGQALVTTAVPLPAGVAVARVTDVDRLGRP
ncbi:MAG: DNA replication/repair protein RecF [Acidimicrobiales bacterium]